MQSIIDNGRRCFICGRPATDVHHIFHGAGLRSVSEKYGLKVPLCREHHTAGPEAVHVNADQDRRLKAYAQAVAMKKYNWTADEFRAKFRKNYL